MPVRAVSPADLVVTRRGLRLHGRTLPCTIGRGGLRTDKREGDSSTPIGTHRIVGMLYRPDRMARPADWAIPIHPRDLWCDASGHDDYNLMVRAPFDASAEALRRADPLYDLVFVTDWNWPLAQAGAGSAIFVHRWRRPGYPTEGCVALRPDHLRWVAGQIGPGTRLIVQP